MAKSKLTIPPKIILPSPGCLKLRCGGCGHMVFRGHIRPTALKTARLVELVCDRCLKVFKVTDNAVLEGDGEITLRTPPG